MGPGAPTGNRRPALEAGELVADRFRAISDAPIRALVHTHAHPDHIVGAGAFVAVDEHTTVQMLRPTHTFSDRLEVEIAGVRVELLHAPGETDDQILVWLPGQGQPLSGAEEIERQLIDCHDAIRYVNDQTIRMTNAGLTPDEFARHIELPPHLAGSAYLQPHYGTPEWSARMVSQGHLGWFDGNPSNLHPTAPVERQNEVAIDIRVRALQALAEQESNRNARHHYLTRAAELAGELTVPFQSVSPNDEMLASIPIPVYFDAMSVALDGRAAREVHRQVAFEFPDLGETYTLIVRRGVTELIDGIVSDPDIHVRVDSLVFKQLLTGQRGPVVTLARDVRFVEGGRIGLARFLRLFDSEVTLPD